MEGRDDPDPGDRVDRVRDPVDHQQQHKGPDAERGRGLTLGGQLGDQQGERVAREEPRSHGQRLAHLAQEVGVLVHARGDGDDAERGCDAADEEHQAEGGAAGEQQPRPRDAGGDPLLGEPAILVAAADADAGERGPDHHQDDGPGEPLVLFVPAQRLRVDRQGDEEGELLGHQGDRAAESGLRRGGAAGGLLEGGSIEERDQKAADAEPDQAAPVQAPRHPADHVRASLGTSS